MGHQASRPAVRNDSTYVVKFMTHSQDFDFSNLDITTDRAPDLFDTDHLVDLTLDSSTLTSPQISFSVPVPRRAPHELSQNVEDHFIDLLTSQNRQDILTLTSEMPNLGTIPPEVFSAFQSDYLLALSHNPALKWYGKLTKALTSEQFSAQDGSLTLVLPPELFRKIIYPFLGQFPTHLAETSPLVDLVYQLAEQFETQTATPHTTKSRDRLPTSDLKIDHLDLSPQYLDSTADLEIDFDGFQDSVDTTDTYQDPTHTFKISLVDLSNKAIAEHLASQYPDERLFDEANTRLLDEGFSRARANEITAILRYMRLNDRLNRPTGNRGGGDIDFNFGV